MRSRARLAVLVTASLCWSRALAQTIVTVAGGESDDPRPALAVGILPNAVAVDAAGNIFVSDAIGHRIRRVSVASGIMTTYAGTGLAGSSGDGGPATQAVVSGSRGLALDAAGNVLLLDGAVVRRVAASTGIITTIAGGGTQGRGDGGPATLAAFRAPSSIALDRDGNLYVADGYDFRVRKITVATGIITTIAGTDNGFGGDGGPATAAQIGPPSAVAVDGGGNVFIGDPNNHRVWRVSAASGTIQTYAGEGSPGDSGDGGPATAAKLDNPRGLAVDPAGDLLVADSPSGRVRKISSASGRITTVAGKGNLAGFGSFSGDGGPATAAGLYNPSGLAVGAAGDLYIADYGNGRIREVSATTGIIETVAGNGFAGFSGDGGPGTAAQLNRPMGLVTDASGNVLFADNQNSRIRRIAPGGIITTVAGDEAFDPDLGDGGPATAAYINQPYDIALDEAGSLYIADTHNNRIRRVSTSGVISTFAGVGPSFMQGTFSGDGGPATGAHISGPSGLAFDARGDLYLCDSDNDRVRKIALPSGTISTVAGSGVGRDSRGFSGDGGPATAAHLATPRDLLFDRAGNLLISDTGNRRVRQVSPAGVITTVAGTGEIGFSGDGGPAADAAVSPVGLALDADGGILIADSYNNRIRRLTPSGTITTIAGTGTAGFSGDGGPATAAQMSGPYSVAFDPAGNLFVSDSGNQRVRRISACADVMPPALLSPAAGASIPGAVTLSWSPVPNAAGYDVLLDTVSPPAGAVATGLAATSLTLSNLAAGATYFWRIVAKGDPFCPASSAAPSEVRGFTTAGGCAAPPSFALLSPDDGGAGASTQVRLSWAAAAGAATYDVYLGSANPPPLAASGLAATSYEAAGLSPGLTYRWFVVAHAACDATKTSATSARTFSVAGDCARAASFSQIAPAGGATGVGVAPTLSWTPSAGAAGYDVYLGTSSTPPLFASGVTRTSLVASGLARGGVYFWSVVARVTCGTGLDASTPVLSFSVAGTCPAPGATSFTFLPPGGVAAGQTYAVAWAPAAGLDAAGGTLVERARDAAFSSGVESHRTSGTTASFHAASPGTYYHRVRAFSGCGGDGPSSPVAAVNVVAGKPNVVFTVQPDSVVTALGERLEERKTSFTLENLSASTVQLLLGSARIDSQHFFDIYDPLGGDAAFVTLEPRKPRSYEVRFSGPPSDRPGSYQGIVFFSAPGLAVTPYAFVSLKVGGAESATPVFHVGGAAAEYAFFPGSAGDDSARPPISVDIHNPGSAPLELGAEIGPEVWLEPEPGWNATAIAPGASRTVLLYTKRVRAPSGSALPRYTYFTVRTKSGQTARLLAQDNDASALRQGRGSQLDRSVRSYLVPSVVHAGSSIGGEFVSRVRLSNTSTEDAQAELIFTPSATDGFDPSVKRAVVVVPRNDLVNLTDPLVQLFGLTPPVFGTLEVRTAPERAGFLTVTSGVDAPAAGGGTFGFQMPSVIRGEGARLGSPHLIPGITSTAAYRTNLILAETTGIDGAVVRAVLYDNKGNRLGDTAATVPRYGQQQINRVVTALGGTGNLEAGRLELVVESGGGSVVGVVTVIDNANNDAVTYVSRPQACRPTPARGRCCCRRS